MAFDKLCRENKKDSALRLAGCMLKHSYISLGIGDIDWEIDMAIRQCGGEPRTGYRYTARFHFNLKTEMDKEIYTEAAARSLPSFITVCTGNRILPYTGKTNG